MSTQEERKNIVSKLPIYQALTLLLGLVITCSIVLGATLANSARDLFAGTGLGIFMGTKANEGSSLGLFVIAAIISVSIIYLRTLYGISKYKELMPVL